MSEPGLPESFTYSSESCTHALLTSIKVEKFSRRQLNKKHDLIGFFETSQIKNTLALIIVNINIITMALGKF